VTDVTSLGDRLDAIHLKVRVPGTDIEAVLRDRTDVTISFGDGGYQWLAERDLEHHMASLARLLYTAWVRAYHAALPDAFLSAMDAPSDQREQDFLEARAQLREHGASGDGRIAISATDMHDIKVRITPGTLRSLSEGEFVADTREAVAVLLADRRAKVRELKLRYFG
jgi:hypothetical protein